MSNEWSHPDIPSGVVERPEPVSRAMKLMYLSAVLGLATTVISLLDRDALEAEARRSLEATGITITDEALAAAIMVGTVTAIIFALVIGALWFILAHYNGKGRSWARTVGTVLGVVGVLMNVAGLAAGGLGSGSVITIASTVLIAAILYLLWRPENARFFAQPQQPN